MDLVLRKPTTWSHTVDDVTDDGINKPGQPHDLRASYPEREGRMATWREPRGETRNRASQGTNGDTMRSAGIFTSFSAWRHG